MMLHALTLAAALLAPHKPALQSHAPGVRVATVCFRTSVDAPAGSTVQYCHYSCLGTDVIITIPATKICPLNIDR